VARPAAAGQDGAVAGEWTSMAVTDVRTGDRVRLGNGDVLTVGRVEESFMGMPTMVAIIEDTPERWFKAPMPKDGTIEVQRPG